MDPIVIPVMGILLPLVLVPMILVLKHQWRKREYEHLERMKILEMGHPLPQSHAWSAVTATAIGAGVPLGAFLCAWLASVTSHHVGEEAWISALMVGLAGVGGGVYLAHRLLSVREPRPTPETTAAVNGKPITDPDAYDVAGRRG